MEPTKTADLTIETPPKIEPNYNWFVIYRDKDGSFFTTTANSVVESEQIKSRLASEKPERDIWIAAMVVWERTEIVSKQVQPASWVSMQQKRECVN